MRVLARTGRPVLVAACAALAAAALPASADSSLVVSRDGTSPVFDVSTAAERWSFTVTSVTGTGHAPHVFVRLYSEDPTRAFSTTAYGRARVGETFTTYQALPPGVYKLGGSLWGGNGPVTVTVAVDAP